MSHGLGCLGYFVVYCVGGLDWSGDLWYIGCFSLQSSLISMKLFKQILFAGCLMGLWQVAEGQTGANCASAIPLTLTSTATTHSLALDPVTQELWVSFTASSDYVHFELEGPSISDNVAHIHQMALFTGHCGAPTLIGGDALSLAEERYSMEFNLEVGPLVPSITYWVRISQVPIEGACPKVNCHTADDVAFDLTVKTVDCVVPPETDAPLWGYEVNRGQLLDTDGDPADDVLYFSGESYPHMYVSDEVTSFVWSKIDGDTTTDDTLHRIDLSLAGGNGAMKVMRGEMNMGVANYYLGHAPNGVLGNRSFDRLVAQNVYNGVDMHWYSDADGMKLYLVAAPEVETDVIKLHFEGDEEVLVSDEGGLEIVSSMGTMVWEPATVFQINGSGARVPLSNSGIFSAQGGNNFGISVNGENASWPVVIQIDRVAAQTVALTSHPEWGTFYGGGSSDACLDMDTDDDRNLYVTGETYNLGYPVSAGIAVYAGGLSEAFVGKFNENYVRVWMTMYGGGGGDVGVGVAYDAGLDRVYMVGEASQTTPAFPLLGSGIGSFVQNYASGVSSGFVAGFDATLGLRHWVSLFGGNNSVCSAVETDVYGNVYIVGSTYEGQTSATSSPTAGAYPICGPMGSYQQNVNNQATPGSESDGFIAKFSPQTALVWSTLFGGSGGENLVDVGIDHFYQRLYVVGATKSPSLTTNTCPGTGTTSYMSLCDVGGYFNDAVNGNNVLTTANGDGLIARFNFDGELNWSSFFGGPSLDAITGIAIRNQNPGVMLNPDGTFYITGFTSSSTYSTQGAQTYAGGFPACSTGSAYQQAFGGGTDAFVARFDGNTNLNWSTYLGGAGDDHRKLSGYCPGPRIGATPQGECFVVGGTRSGAGSTTGVSVQVNNVFYEQQTHGDASGGSNAVDAYVMGFDNNRQQIYGAYYGGTQNEYGQAISVCRDRVYIGGTTMSTGSFPLYNPISLPGTAWFQPYPLAGGFDAFYSQLQVGSIVGQAEVSVASLGHLQAWPNPSSGDLHVKWELEKPESVSLQLFDLQGRLLQAWERSAGQNSLEISLAGLPEGLYLLEMVCRDGAQTLKIAKR